MGSRLGFASPGRFGALARCLVASIALLITVSGSISSAPAPATSKGANIVLQRYRDKTEQAFELLIPKGWIVSGGIKRVDPSAAGGAAQSIEAKVEFSVKKDPNGSVMLKWMPHVYYADLTGQPAAGMFPVGSNYGGMPVHPCVPAGSFLKTMMFPSLRKSAGKVKVVSEKSQPEAAAAFKRFYCPPGSGLAALGIDVRFDAATVVVTYEEQGKRFKEAMFTAIENRGPAVAGQWTNRGTFLFRAPEVDFASYAPLAGLIASSVQLSPKWIAAEIKGEMTRAGIAADVQKLEQEIDKSITEHRRTTNSEINNDMFLTLMQQEEYVNPFTKEIEIGTNLMAHRWENQQGDIVYTRNPDYDPNTDINLGAARGFKRSPVRPRRP